MSSELAISKLTEKLDETNRVLWQLKETIEQQKEIESLKRRVENLEEEILFEEFDHEEELDFKDLIDGVCESLLTNPLCREAIQDMADNADDEHVELTTKAAEKIKKELQ